MIRVASLRLATTLLLVPAALAAQEAGAFTITRGADTVALERWSRDSSILSASLTRVAGASARERVRYKATLLPDASAPLIELSVWRGEDPEDMPARQTTRIIFKDDSVAVDEATRWSGVRSIILPTQRSAIAYLNLSIALMEQATRRAESTRGDSVAVPFFNLGGGQTVTGVVRRIGADSALVRIGTVEFRLKVDGTGRILGGSVPSQGLEITRGAGR
ncbi:MAG TPA: hypothetical protein VLD58_00800 [Gemmatimonadales bacterium]|nr:hypothetical protein [Gemmatimonadales bacterium]